MIDIDKTISKLLKISQQILDEIEVLSSLSYHDRENTDQFRDHVTDISEYLSQEKAFIDTIIFPDLLLIFRVLSEKKDESDAYCRCYVNLDDRIANHYANEDDEEEEIESFETDDDEVDDTEEETEASEKDDASFILKYNVDEGENEKYAIQVVDNMATIVIKKMLTRLIDTLADTKRDTKYKKTLIRNFKKFKYFYFTLDNKLEMLGADYMFDIDKIPMPYQVDCDTTQIFHNQCVTILGDFYEAKGIDYTPSKMEEYLFDMMLLEEYLNGIDDESIPQLISLTDELEERYGANFFGSIAKQKVLLKKN